MRNYVTVQGDMWDSIAYKVYGSEKYMNTLIEANTAYHDYVVFPAGIMLLCPAVESEKAKILPPWKRG